MDQSYEKRLLSSPYKSPIKLSSPLKSPNRDHYSDRYIPVRDKARWQCSPALELFANRKNNALESPSKKSIHGAIPNPNSQCDILSMLIENELGSEKNTENESKDRHPNCENHLNLFSFRKVSDSPQKLKTSFVLSPVSEKTQKLLQQPKSEFRNIPKLPYKVLDAPDLHDDFYLNLVDWSSRNILAVGLGTSVYLWSAYNSKVLRLFDAAFEQDIVTSVAWHSKGLHLAVGTYKGRVQIWDVDSKKRIGVLPGHDARVGALAWNSHLLASGSRDRLILLRDIREKESTGESNFFGFLKGSNNLVVDKREYSEKTIRESMTVPSTSKHRRPRILKSSRLSKVSDIFRNLDSKDKVSTNSSDDESSSKRINKSRRKLNSDSDNRMGSSNGTDNDDERMDNSDDEAFGESSMKVSKRDSSQTKGMGDLSLDDPLSAVTGISVTDSPVQKTLSSTRCFEEFPSIRKENNFRPLRILRNHRQEICGLKWSPEGQYLASGGNDNQLFIWDPVVGGSAQPIYSYDSHVAAVKAIAWSPHKHGLLASGGGTADRTIRFWNTLTGQALHSVDTGSQVCNIVWSPHDNELLTTHGYSENQILVWQYPAMKRLAKLIGHTSRVLYLAISPDGENIVTGAGDETLRFWNVFAKNKDDKSVRSSLNLFECMR